jgi:hypothetical protein
MPILINAVGSLLYSANSSRVLKGFVEIEKYPAWFLSLSFPDIEELSPEEITGILKEIGELLKQKRESIAKREPFAAYLGIATSSMFDYENGGDMYLSTFVKLLHGLGIKFEDLLGILK